MPEPEPIVLADGTETTDPRLDRLRQFDERSRRFAVRDVITAPQPRSYSWSVPLRLNQGREGACVGFSVSHEAAARPVSVQGITNATARALYIRAQQLDDWPGEEPTYAGTSVLAGIKAARERGWYGEFRWGFGVDDLALAVGYKGPAVLGINWYVGMYRPDANGFIRPGGELAGGHAIVCNGVSVRSRAFKLTNSWGPNWGRGGECYVTWDDMARLLSEDGEVCVPLQRAGA